MLGQHIESSREKAAAADDKRRRWEQAAEAAEASSRADASRLRARLVHWAVALGHTDAARRESDEEVAAAAREAADSERGERLPTCIRPQFWRWRCSRLELVRDRQSLLHWRASSRI